VLRTPLCELLRIDAPILCAPFGPWDQVELAVAVCEAGGLGALGTAVLSVPELEAQWRALRERTDRPFAINHTIRPFDEDAFAATLRFAPPAISFHIGVIPELIERAHAAGCLWIQQVIDREQAEAALAAGADVLVAQGGEAGGHGGWVGTIVLVPELVDLAGAVPVVAAGGIADGRGVAAALALGAQGVLVGTRFLASTEMSVNDAWKQRVVEAGALDAVKVPHSERVLPPYNRPGGPADPRALRTPLIDRLGADPESVDPATAGPELLAALREDRAHEYLPFTGQSAALIHDVRPAAEIVRELVEGAEAALARALSARAAS
jgi:nitronate monooxygenase/enoyl-[acyl-carrier protein] reductase II